MFPLGNYTKELKSESSPESLIWVLPKEQIARTCALFQMGITAVLLGITASDEALNQVLM
jgi:hypothetical protein